MAYRDSDSEDKIQNIDLMKKRSNIWIEGMKESMGN